MDKSVPVDYASVEPWELYSENLKTDYMQSVEEGKDVAAYKSLVDDICTLPRGETREALADVVYEAMKNAADIPGYPYEEPSDLEGIRRARPSRRIALPKPAKADLRDKITGAWLGRICGCLLGKPVEGWHSSKIKEHLLKTDAYPLSGYMKKGNAYGGSGWVCDLNGCAPVDDDTNYTVMAALEIVGRHGRNFTPGDVADVWLSCQPKTAYCTAERVAYKNFLLGIRPPKSAEYKNPFREWIGAQIRGDYFGYINPGDTETAAEMAWWDASISHVKNGIYGEMFVSAMLAAAAVCGDIATVIRAGLAEIPERSRLARDVNEILGLYEGGKTKDEVFSHIHGKYDEAVPHHWCHTNSNAMIVAAALLYGGGDYGRSICMAVETGFDTDCNGATVGSVLGMMLGASAVGPEWTTPINGTLDTSILSAGRISVSKLVDITLGCIASRGE